MNPASKRKLIEAMRNVNARYLPGCVEYYDDHPSNPWQKAVDELETALGSHDTPLVNNQITIYENTLLRLIEEFRAVPKQRELNMGEMR